MLDRPFLYNIIYALAASGGRDARLFGDGFALSQEAFERSLPGSGFPELWFELPLAGRPWFDLHALASHETIGSHTTFSSHETGGYPELFSWFARQGREARQLALSWDVSSGDIAHPAVQLLVGDRVSATTCAFLEKAGRSDAVPAYRAFLDRLPNGWFACYTGVFPARPDMNLRVECIPRPEQQQAYANDPALLEAHLQQVGLPVLGDTLVERCQLLAQTPFQLEFQFDVEADGMAGPTIGVSVRFAGPQGMGPYDPFDPEGAGGDLMRRIEAWGLADDRWKLLYDASFAKGLKNNGVGSLLYNYLAFLKLRWRDGLPLDAKVYYLAGLQDLGTPR